MEVLTYISPFVVMAPFTIVGLGAIVNDDQLFVVVVLAQKVVDCPQHECATVVGRHDTGDERKGLIC